MCQFYNKICIFSYVMLLFACSVYISYYIINVLALEQLRAFDVTSGPIRLIHSSTCPWMSGFVF